MLLALAGAMPGPLVEATHITIAGPPPQLHLAVGSLGTTIDTVTFNVPADSIGTPVTGSQPIVIEVAVRRGGGPGGGATTVFLLANSSTPLTNGPFSIPMTEISWTSAGGVIPSGAFTGSASQLLLTFLGPSGTTRQEDTLTFSYANTTLMPAGTYTGTVVYTAFVL